MGSETQNRLKLAFQLFSYEPWTLDAAKAVLAAIAIKQPTIFLRSYGRAKELLPDVFCEFTSAPSRVEVHVSNADALPLDHDRLTPEPATVAPVVEEPDLPAEALSVVDESSLKAVEKPKKPRPAKRSKTPKQAQEASGPSAAVDLPASAQEVKPAEPAEPTELTSVCLDSFDAASQYLLQRALVQFAKVNEAKAQEILSGKLPVEIDIFCQKIHANNLRRALVRVKGTKVSLKTTPIMTGVK